MIITFFVLIPRPALGNIEDKIAGIKRLAHVTEQLNRQDSNEGKDDTLSKIHKKRKKKKILSQENLHIEL